ncbi:G5 domain-containing protein [Caminicella sporogenes]|uniref:G5 domain-containing protein n=1 Tax=Caminicella sporogenes TaxID=166485 RepID=UPI00254071CE|nr:G5 domain-containing protein [Caminicella sporogenes]WIF95947.1 G5 domain-containing protein [Caminicella sporogenes]
MEFKIKLQEIIKNKKIMMVVVIMLLLSIFVIGFAFRKEITIVDGDKKITIKTVAFNVSGVLKKAGITLKEQDKLSIDSNAKLKNGMVIEIKRAFPVKIKVDGKELDVLTANNLVKDILKQYNIKLGEKDRTQPSLESNVTANDIINVIRCEEKIVREEMEIPYKTVIKYNDSIEAGKTKRFQNGKNGKKEVEYKVVYENGEEVAREVVSEKVIKKPVDEIIEKGSEKYFVASRGKVIRYKKVLIMQSTAYDLSYQSTGKRPDHPEYGITYTGTRVRHGVVAVDPRVIPLGSKLYIESLDGSKDYGFASAEDTGSAIKGKKIDLFFEDHRAAMRYGRRKVRVYILE